MKTFEEKWTAWLDGELKGAELAEFEASLPDKAAAEAEKREAHKLGAHGLSEQEFYNSGVFRGAIERIRGQFSATMREKREFVQAVLNFMQDGKYIGEWNVSGSENRHDYAITMPSGRTAVIELKGCLDGKNTNIFERPPHAHEFIIWSVCTNPGADQRDLHVAGRRHPGILVDQRVDQAGHARLAALEPQLISPPRGKGEPG